VLDGWWARKELSMKCNLWLHTTHFFWNRIDQCLLVANLSDPNVIEKLNTYKEEAQKPCIIIGLYNHISPATQIRKKMVMEWADELPFVEIDLESNSGKIDVWYSIFNHVTTVK
jgi:hypothetical protein